MFLLYFKDLQKIHWRLYCETF